MNNFAVALTKECCPVCLKEKDGAIVMNTKLTKKAAHEVEELHNKVVGYSDCMCDECLERVGTGIYLITMDCSESYENPIRTGEVFKISREVFEDTFDVPFPKQQMAFIEKSAIDFLLKGE